MNKFKVGDRVKLRYVPHVGSVVSTNDKTSRVLYESGESFTHQNDLLQLVAQVTTQTEIRSTSDSGAEKGVKPETDAVSHPAHYGGDTTYEAIKVITAWGLGFDLGNVTKYVARAGKKDPTKELEDLRKARFYLDHRINQLEQK